MRERPLLNSRPLLQALSPEVLLIDTGRRGADQRHLWVRAIAAVHPVYRTSAAALVAAMVCAAWLRDSLSQGECVGWQVGVLIVCHTVLALGLLVAAMVLVAAAVAASSFLAAQEERKDADVTDQDLAAAACCAAYNESPRERMEELRARGVLSGNWRVDRRLSTPTVAVFVNWHTQTVLIAFRGSATLADWTSNVRLLAPLSWPPAKIGAPRPAPRQLTGRALTSPRAR